MHDTVSVEEFLEHHGVKGQKWGVRRAQKRTAKAEKHWQKEVLSGSTYVKVYNAAADRMNSTEITRINNKYKDKDVSDWSKGIGKTYLNEYMHTFNKMMNEEGRRLIPDSPLGKSVRFDNTQSQDFPVLQIVDKTAKHAPEDTVTAFKLVRDPDGFIIKIVPVTSTALQQSAQAGEDFLEHVGVKGMKWGKRKRRGSFDSRRTRYDKASKRLTEAELTKRIKRLELEKKYNELNKRSVGHGERTAIEIITKVGKNTAIPVLTGATIFAVGQFVKRRLAKSPNLQKAILSRLNPG